MSEEKRKALELVHSYFQRELEQEIRTVSLCDWGEENFYISDTQSRIKFLYFQRVLLNFMLDPELDFQTYIYSSLKKSGKTTVSGCVARWIAETWGKYNEVFCMANDEEQARGRIYAKVQESIELDPRFDRGKRVIPDLWKIIRREIKNEQNGSFIRSVSKDNRGEAGSNPTGTFWSELWGYTCMSQNHEVLTSTGWKSFDVLTLQDEIATLNTKNEFEWQQPEKIHIHDYDGDLLRFQHRRCDMLVTPNHRVLGKFYTNSRYRFEPTEQKIKTLNRSNIAVKTELKTYDGAWHEYAADAADYAFGEVKADCDYKGTSRKYFILPAYKDRPARKLDANLWFTFFGWYIAEGCVTNYTKGIPYVTNVAQSINANLSNYEDIFKLLNELNFNFSINDNSFLIFDVQIAAYLKQFGKSQDKFIPREYKESSKEQLDLLFKAYLAGDGWFAGREGFQCQTVSAQLKDDLIEIGLKCGYIPRVMNLTKLNHPTQQPIYRLSFSNAPIVWQRDHEHWTKEHYEGKVWCVTVPNSTFYVRRNGFCYWTGNSEDDLRLYEELTPVPTRPRSIRWIDSYAGYHGESELLFDEYDGVVNKGSRLTHADLEQYGGWPFADPPPIYVNTNTRTVAYWDEGIAARRCPWQTEDYYAVQAGKLRPLQFDRLHNNFWTSSVDSFLPIEWWDAIEDKELPALTANEPVVIGVDASVSKDCTAAVIVSRHPKNKRQAAIRKCRLWVPPKNGKLNYSAEDGLKPTLIEWCKQYNVSQIAYDEFQLHHMMTELRNERTAWTKVFSQNSSRLKADNQLYDMIRDKELWHCGNEVGDIRAHINNAAAKYQKDEDSKMRIIKKGKMPIDLVIATSMALEECMRLNLG